MIVNIYDVGHGFTAYVRDEITGANSLIDCGFNEETGFHPVDEILDEHGAIGGLIVQNYDEDHINGIPHLIERAGVTPVSALYGNPLTNLQLMGLKWPPSNSMWTLMGLRNRYNGPLPASRPGGEVQISQYWNPYPVFTDTNNLSLVTFVHSPGYSLVFPGDMEKAGWRALLRNASFRAELARVNVFVAAHHGRESGYCEDVFDYCTPDIVVISDEPMQYDTQEHEYAQHATGLSNLATDENRYVLTTWCDGHIRIVTPPGQNYVVRIAA